MERVRPAGPRHVQGARRPPWGAHAEGHLVVFEGKKMRENHKISPGGVAFLPHGCLLVLFSTREAMVKDDARWPRASVSQDTTRMGEEKNKEKKKRKELNPKLVKQHVLIGDETPQVECHQV